MKCLSFASVILCLPLIVKGADDASAKDKESLQGIWQFDSLDTDGPKPPPEEMKKMKLTIKDNKMSHPGAQGKTEEATFELDATATPKTIDMTTTGGTEKGEKLQAIYSLDGDTLKLCIAAPGKERPKEFKAVKERTVVMVFKREKP